MRDLEIPNCQVEQPGVTGAGDRGRMLLFAGSLLVIWVLVINRLRGEWTLNPEYAYGWFVPALCLYLGWLRVAGSAQGQVLTPGSRMDGALAVVFLAALTLLYVPTRLIHEVNPGWGFADWAIGLEWVAITLVLLWRVAGRSWTRALAFPICFFLIAIPWPWGIREMVVQTLTRWNIAAGIEILGWMGIPALQKGNVVEIATGLVGIEEACSGIRSIQASLMIGLFFGELYRFSVRGRVALVLGGIGLAFLLNILRTLLLVSVASRAGVEAIQKWHDPIGVPILVGCFIGVWAMAWRNRTRTQSRGDSVFSIPGPWWRVLGRGSYAAPAIALGFVAAEIGTEGWYRWHENRAPAAMEWSAQAPVSGKDLAELPISARQSTMLGYDAGFACKWTDDAGRGWQMFYFRWLPHRRELEIQSALGHRPEICLPASGFVLRSDLGIERWEVAGLSLPFRTYLFEQAGRPVYVFRCGMQDGTERIDPGHALSYSGRRERLQAVWEGRRRAGARVLELGVWGCHDLDEAKRAFRHVLDEIVTDAGG